VVSDDPKQTLTTILGLADKIEAHPGWPRMVTQWLVWPARLTAIRDTVATIGTRLEMGYLEPGEALNQATTVRDSAVRVLALLDDLGTRDHS